MKRRLAILLGSFCLTANLFADDTRADELMWTSAYVGDFSIAQKLMLTRHVEGINDLLLDQFVMMYTYYRMQEYEKAEAVFKDIDSCIEYYLIDIKA
jgi:hypothetical protein